MSVADIQHAARMIELANDNIAQAIRALNERYLRDAAWHLRQASELFERAHYASARADLPCEQQQMGAVRCVS